MRESAVDQIAAMDSDQIDALIDYLGNCLTSERKAKIETVLTHRTRYVTVVLEDIHTSQNAGAVLRNCDIFGIQDVHIIEQTSNFKVNLNVTRGCQKWLTIHRYRKQRGNTRDCINALRTKGYCIIATTPHTKACELPALPLDRPIAILFGNELDGLSSIALDQADHHLKIPMYGFSESFNISVSTALCLQSICDRLRQSPHTWQLTLKEQKALRLKWYRGSCKNFEQLEVGFWKTLGV
ncbi:TrmH family RNA methyltransferase [Leptothoe spongobia]|uniref:tRNA (guanosine(18)-2'-O)-methyltransferase n=1 Tax=Leptothoe spongobia TAU-MAC 1115 TaxID=1967444 RepID=A0A947DFV2_9CYAN|nr:RNA methyltransferase [Leptothoe spongobia]MBT9316145.1 RNA methyltransferase [Leptothoe spongobia TAU-MAC 1115]